MRWFFPPPSRFWGGELGSGEARLVVAEGRAFAEGPGDEGLSGRRVALGQAYQGEASRGPRGEQRQVLGHRQRPAEGLLGVGQEARLLQGDPEGTQGGGGPAPMADGFGDRQCFLGALARLVVPAQGRE